MKLPMKLFITITFPIWFLPVLAAIVVLGPFFMIHDILFSGDTGGL